MVRSAIKRRLLWLAGCMIASLFAAGCDWGPCDEIGACHPRKAWPGGSNGGAGDDGSGAGGTGGTGGDGGGAGGTSPVCPEDPAAVEGGFVRPDCGVWVRDSSPGDDENPGTQDAPLKTIGQAVVKA